ncbi:MAG: hypothetical protein H8E98_02675 [Bacteroidetes bacterium]|nr:hypothetical protein [Bacteroidota bacterium]
MAADWGTFQTSVVQFLKSKSSKDFDQTSHFFANQYDTVIKTSALLVGNIAKPPSNGPVYAAFLTAFNLMYNSPTDLGVAPYNVLASQIISTYWTSMQFDPLPPHPPTVVPAPGVSVLYYGDSSSLGIELYNAFNSKEETLVASNLVLAFSNHMKLVSGLYTGLIPTPTGPVPSPPIPWVGVF